MGYWGSVFEKLSQRSVDVTKGSPLYDLVKKERQLGPATGDNSAGRIMYLQLKAKGVVPNDPPVTAEPLSRSVGGGSFGGYDPDATKTSAVAFTDELRKMAAVPDTQMQQKQLNANRRVGRFLGTIDHQKLYGPGPSYKMQAVLQGGGQIDTPASVKGALS